jgi:hypothetical protein
VPSKITQTYFYASDFDTLKVTGVFAEFFFAASTVIFSKPVITNGSCEFSCNHIIPAGITKVKATDLEL